MKNLVKDLNDNPDSYFNEDGVSFEELKTAIELENDSFVCDLSTATGRKISASHAFGCSKLKSAIDNAGKSKVAVIKKQASVIDARRKEAREYLDEQRDLRRLPLSDWEVQEESRKASHQAILNELVDLKDCGQLETSEEIESRIKRIEAIEVSEAELQEFSHEAEVFKKSGLEMLAIALNSAVNRERQEAELEALRIEKAKRDLLEAEAAEKREAEEAVRLEAEIEKSKADRIAREKADDAHVAAENARRDAEAKAEAERNKLIKEQEEAKAKAEAEKQALIREHKEAEAKRIADEDRTRLAEEARAANVEHRKEINNKALAAISEKTGVDEETAKKIVVAIFSGEIPNISIKY